MCGLLRLSSRRTGGRKIFESRVFSIYRSQSRRAFHCDCHTEEKVPFFVVNRLPTRPDWEFTFGICLLGLLTARLSGDEVLGLRDSIVGIFCRLLVMTR